MTVIDSVVAPLLQSNDPEYREAVNTELLQLFATSTVGALTDEFSGDAFPLPGPLVHPLIVCVTVYVPDVVTVIEEVVAPLLHKSEPVNPEAVKTELSQLFTTETLGAAGMTFGSATPVPATLLHPFTVCVTE